MLKSFYVFVLLPVTLVFVSGCGGGDNSNNAPVACAPGTVSYNGTCGAAYTGAGVGATSCQGSCPTPDLVQTSMGCLPQAGCAPCMGSNNGFCTPSISSFPNGGAPAFNQGGFPPPPGYPGINPYYVWQTPGPYYPYGNYQSWYIHF